MWLLDKLMNKKQIPVPPMPAEHSGADSQNQVELPEIDPELLPPMPPMEKIPVREIVEDPTVDTFNANPIKPEMHFEKKVEEKVQEFFFIEKNEYSGLLVEMSDVEVILKDSVSHTSEFVEIKKEEDVIAEEFRVVMEDIEKKLIFVDKTLFGA